MAKRQIYRYVIRNSQNKIFYVTNFNGRIEYLHHIHHLSDFPMFINTPLILYIKALKYKQCYCSFYKMSLGSAYKKGGCNMDMKKFFFGPLTLLVVSLVLFGVSCCFGIGHTKITLIIVLVAIGFFLIAITALPAWLRQELINKNRKKN